MKSKNIVLVSDLIKNKPDTQLPQQLMDKYIEISCPEALSNYEYMIHYDDESQRIDLKYMSHDSCPSDYWSDQDIGELFHYRSIDLSEKINSLERKKQPYFFIATYEHGLERHYPLLPGDSFTTCRWDTGIKSIFVPSQRFIEECNNDLSMMKDRLDSYFDEYSDWCNGEVYLLNRDSYKTDTSSNTLFISDFEVEGGYIGHKNARDCLYSEF